MIFENHDDAKKSTRFFLIIQQINRIVVFSLKNVYNDELKIGLDRSAGKMVQMYLVCGPHRTCYFGIETDQGSIVYAIRLLQQQSNTELCLHKCYFLKTRIT